MTSIAFAQSNNEGNAREIVLDVDSILEGSMRKDGDNIRITAQLISTEDGFPIWSESYDRELADIFETQEDIATAVTGALGVRLGVGGVNEFRGAGTQNVEAYEVYLQALATRKPGQTSRQSLSASIDMMGLATQLDPNYAAAWARLAGMTISSNWHFPPHEAPAIFEKALPFAMKAVELNPESALAHTFMGAAQYVQMNWIGGEQSLTRAIELLPDRETVGQYGNMLMRVGRSAAARTEFDKAEALEPLDGRPMGNRQYVSVAQSNYDEARDLLTWKSDATTRYWNLAIALNEGSPEEVKSTLAAMHSSNIAALSAQVLSEFESVETVLSILRRVFDKAVAEGAGDFDAIALFAAYFGDPKLALQARYEDVRYTPARLGALWFPVMSEARQLDEFKEIVTKLNLVDYWRTYGWADTCRPLGDDDFECF
jgi:tetratricopeptide (TPR) repeat protein